ncbi:DUF2087 domain-containing protein [Staphylococcus lutrae]|uniref:DUF2087 domain-containing protein n=1 Tax=Staphylococcus lutrae TaxID=155085 RepID=A0AAC9RQ61_9STAP|nr:DUF2087 domain-containing protein [Staphylococcus lutrae]ARJ50083.1 hypothetical protein B5P37_01280 [Staphylococcus lutrae]PNZ35493.1 DUF2087 domain-containing protein [Staphylococcus lutrae]
MSDVKKRFMKDHKIHTIPRKEKDKKALMEIIAAEFESEKNYSEKEINAVLQSFYDDYVLLRRYLVDYSLLTRDNEGKEYKVSRNDEGIKNDE